MISWLVALNAKKFGSALKNEKNSWPDCKVSLKYKCERCSRLYGRFESLNKHLRLECNKEPKFCGHHWKYKSKREDVLNRHIRTKHLPQDSDSNKCIKCGKNFSQHSNLLRLFKLCVLSTDLRRMLRPYRFSCGYCNYKRAYKSSLAKHIQAGHVRKSNI